jgi:hypothetical protein
MSGIGDLLKSGASSLAGAVSEKLGVDPSMAQSLVDQVVPGDDAAPAETGAAGAQAEEQGGIMGKVSSMLDQDGVGNPINDIVGMAGKLFGGNK